MPWRKQGFRDYIPSLTWQCDPQVENAVAQYPASALIVDLGSGGRKIAPHVTTVDFVATSGTDIIADVTRTPLQDNSVDLVVATGLLEHVEDDRALLREIVRILKPGGAVYLEVPFLVQHHDDPIDCRRLTLPGLELLLRQHGLSPQKSGVHIGPTVTLLTLTAHYFAILLEGPTLLNKILANGAYVLLATLFFPFKFIDKYAGRKRNAYQLAFGVYCTATKNP